MFHLILHVINSSVSVKFVSTCGSIISEAIYLAVHSHEFVVCVERMGRLVCGLCVSVC